MVPPTEVWVNYQWSRPSTDTPTGHHNLADPSAEAVFPAYSSRCPDLFPLVRWEANCSHQGKLYSQSKAGCGMCDNRQLGEGEVTGAGVERKLHSETPGFLSLTPSLLEVQTRPRLWQIQGLFFRKSDWLKKKYPRYLKTSTTQHPSQITLCEA